MGKTKTFGAELAAAAECARARLRMRMSAAGAESGQGAAEYAVIAGLVLVVAATLGIAFSNEISDTFQWGIDQMNTIQASTHTPTP